MNSSRIWIAFAILAIGFLAAWPFRHPSLPPMAEAVTESRLAPLERRDFQFAPLPPLPASENSPAVGLTSPNAAVSNQVTSAREASAKLGFLETPPEMPRRFDVPLASLKTTEFDSRNQAFLADDHPLDASQQAAGGQVHRIRKGDTLPKISVAYYDSPEYAEEIFLANRQVLVSADLLPLGKELQIPPRSRLKTVPTAQPVTVAKPTIGNPVRQPADGPPASEPAALPEL